MGIFPTQWEIYPYLEEKLTVWNVRKQKRKGMKKNFKNLEDASTITW